MNRRSFLGSMAGASLAQRAAGKPNVILILTDDQGWFDLGIHGNRYVETPNMDRIAREGVRFTHFYASPVCTPTRASLMTGRHYQRTGAVDTFMGRDTLRADEVTLGQVFQQQGYRTACVGKWHLGRYMKYHPNHRGFDEYFGFWQYGFINRYDDSDELWDNKQPVITTGYVTDVLTDRAIRFVQENRGRPFFLYVAYNAPHAPHLVPDNYIAKYLAKGVPLADARIYGMVDCVDKNIGRLLGGIDDNTVVLFMTDNGGVSHFDKCGLRGNKGSCWEGGVRVPLFARWPGRFPKGAVVDAMAQHIDLFPTLCELISGTGIPACVGSERKLDGKSILRLLRDGRGASPHTHLFHQWNRVRPEASSGAVRDARGYKLMMTGQLFDLNSDTGENRNIAAAHPEIARALQTEYERWFADVTAGQDYGRVPIEVGRDDENPVEIDLTWGDAVGQKVKPTYRHYNRDVVDDWSVPGEAVRWKLDVVRPGRYEVILNYGCRPSDAGSKLCIQAGASMIEHVAQATAGREVFRPLSAGTLVLARGPATLELKALTVPGQELMALHKVWLRRLAE